MFLIAITQGWHPARSLWPTRGLRPQASCLAAGMATSGTVTKWLSELIGHGFSELTEQARRIPAGSKGLLLLPYFAGKRTPRFDVGARGVVAGLTLRHGQGHLYRAMLEGVAYGVRHNLDATRAAGAHVDRLVAVGGGTTGGLWTQIVSDVTGLQQQVRRETVGASYGDAMLAAQAICVTGAADWNPVSHIVVPDAAATGLHDRRFDSFLALYDQTRAVIADLAEDTI